MAKDTALDEGLVVASHGRHCLVETASGARVICHPRGKKSQSVVGDRVQWRASEDEGTIEAVLPRRNLFYRQDDIRTKSFAANLDQVLILLAADPVFSPQQLARALIAAEEQQIRPLVVLNKRDLPEAFARAWERLEPHRRMGYEVLGVSLRATEVDAEMQSRLQGRTTLVLGPSGAGKSTLVNRLVPGAQAQTGEISLALRSGKHTTTTTTWYWMDRESGTALIDSPGFQEFGLHHIAPMQLAQYMPDIRAQAGDCKFYNCSHLHEPGCSVMAMVEGQPRAVGAEQPVDQDRYRIYRELFEELSQTRY